MTGEQDLKELVTRLQRDARDNLASVLLYGSAATGEFHEGHSDFNILCVMRSLGAEDLARLHDVSAWWVKKGHPAPLYFTLDELQSSADLYPIELKDICTSHQVLCGEDATAKIEIPLARHAWQVERELRNNTLRLRQQYLRHPTDSRKTLELMTASISSFAALFRHALYALKETPPATKRESIDRLGAVLGYDLSVFDTIFDIREGRKKERELDVQATFSSYLKLVSQVAEAMDLRLAGA